MHLALESVSWLLQIRPKKVAKFFRHKQPDHYYSLSKWRAARSMLRLASGYISRKLFLRTTREEGYSLNCCCNGVFQLSIIMIYILCSNKYVLVKPSTSPYINWATYTILPYWWLAIVHFSLKLSVYYFAITLANYWSLIQSIELDHILLITESCPTPNS